MRSKDYSQLAVYEEKAFVALLTAGQFPVRWAGTMLAEGGGILKEAPVREVVRHTEDPDDVAFLPPSASVFDALDEFEDFSVRGRRLDAIIIAAAGRRDTSPLNIITIYDMPVLHRAIRRPTRAH